MVDYDDVLDKVEREEKVDSATDYLKKKQRIKKEINRLKRLFADLDKKKKKIVNPTVEKKKNLVNTTIEDIAFMTVTMQDLREKIMREGTTVEYKNGENQYGTKQSPDAQIYLQMSQKQTQAMKILLDCLPKNEPPKTEDDFDDFVDGREDI